jgi:hypothetical protein
MAPAHGCICKHLPCIAGDPERAGQAAGQILLVVATGHGSEALQDLALVERVSMGNILLL